MGQIIEEIITDFTAGMADDPRDPGKGLAQMISNFDIFTHAHRMVPALDSESGDNHADTSQKQNFDIGYWTPASEDRLFALGVVSGSAKAEIQMKVILSTDSNGDLTNDLWQTPANNASASGTTAFGLFKYYKTTGKFYGAKGGTTIWAFTPNGSTAFDDSHRSISYTSIQQGLVHSKDDILYIPYDNKIAANNNGTWTDAALTVPAQYIITSICEFGNYLAIALAPRAGGGRSRVFLWDRDTSLATLSESIDWGDGYLQVLEELDGYLIGISSEANINANTYLQKRIILRASNGSARAKVFRTYLCSSGGSAGLSYVKQKVQSRIFFSMFITIDGIMRRGLWSVGISSSGTFAVANERTIINDTAPGNDATFGFFVVGDYAFISYINASSAHALSKTTDGGTYNGTAIYETLVKNGSDSDLIKKLIGATVMFEPLPAAGKVSLYYKKDAESAWTRLFVFDTDNALSHGAVKIENDANAFTVTIASPGVFTLSNHGLVAGQKIRLATTGALPTGLDTATEYYVLSSGLTSSAFKLSLTSGGSAINTSGSQSGVHTILRDKNLTEGQEFKFRIESNGGAVITGFKYKMEVLDKQLY